MAKTLANQKLVEVDFKKSLKNFSRYKADKKMSILNSIIKGVKDKDIVITPDDVNPGCIDPIMDNVYVAKGKGIIIFIFVPIPIPVPPKPWPGPAGPCFRDAFTKAINAKDAKIARFSKNGVQHLQIKSVEATVEIITK